MFNYRVQKDSASHRYGIQIILAVQAGVSFLLDECHIRELSGQGACLIEFSQFGYLEVLIVIPSLLLDFKKPSYRL